VTASYLQNLTSQLAAGVARLPAPRRAAHIAYLHHGQNADGGWSGRLGASDLYYTAFALRSLAVLDALTPAVGQRAAAFLRSALSGQSSVVDFFSLLYAGMLLQVTTNVDVLAECPADWPERVAALLETFRAEDGGYGKSPQGKFGSTYHTFLVGLCYQLLGQGFPRPDEVRGFITARRRDDGGYVEMAPMPRSGTNPTAAAVGALQLLGGLAADAAATVTEFLLEAQGDEGGLRANTRIPFADLLSTFTGGWTLQQLGTLARLDAADVLAFAQGLEHPDGGFKGHAWDDQRDVEYTFYGLGTLALFAR